MYNSLKNKKISFITIKTWQYFGLALMNFLMIVLSFGLLAPVAIILWEKFICKNSYINGKQLKFNGKIKNLYPKYIGWYLLSIITLGIYWFWARIKYYKWKIEHTEFSKNTSDEKSKFIGEVNEFIILNLISFFICIISLGIAIPWIICVRNKWFTTNTYINGEHLEYNGKGVDLFGYYFLWVLLTIVTVGIYSIWFNKKLIEFNTVNQKINNDSSKESLWDILKGVIIRDKILKVSVSVMYIICISLIIGVNAYMNREFIIKDGVLIKYQGEQSEVVLPDNVTRIGNSAFYGNEYIKIINIPSRVESIDDFAFRDCYNLEIVNIEEGTKKIGLKAFYDCLRLKSIYIPSSVITIEKDAFNGCLDATIYTDHLSKPSLWDQTTVVHTTVIWESQLPS